MPKISIIVPVYKVEAYLRPCMDSLLGQTFKDFELIAVDDGSPDQCGNILEEYAKNDPRVKVIHIENHGVSYARNLGIEQAVSPWICFVDPDDWADSTMLEEAISAAEKYQADLVMWNYYSEFANKRVLGATTATEPIHLLTPEELCDHRLRMLGSCRMNGSFYWRGAAFPWCKLYRAQLVKENNVRFLLNVHPTEDTFFNYLFLEFAKSAVFINKPLFHYRQNEGSVMYRFTDNNFSNIDLVLDALEAFHKKFPPSDPERYQQVIYSRLINTYMLGLVRTFVHKDRPYSFFEALRKMKAQLKEPRYLEAFQNIDTSCLNKKAKATIFFGRLQWTLPLYLLGWMKRKATKL